MLQKVEREWRLQLAPSKARRLLPGGSPGRVRASHPPVSRVGPVAERRKSRTKEPCNGVRSGGGIDHGAHRQAGERRKPTGCLIGHSRQRWGKPMTRRRTRREYAARTGNTCRTSRTGSPRANLTAGNSQSSEGDLSLARKRVQPRNRMRENCTSGSVAGAPGNRSPYAGRPYSRPDGPDSPDRNFRPDPRDTK